MAISSVESVVRDRAGRYGHPSRNFRTIAGLWSIQMSRRMNKPILFTENDVALMMVAVKLARECNSHEADNWTDVAGYARCAEMIWGCEDAETTQAEEAPAQEAEAAPARILDRVEDWTNDAIARWAD